MRFILPPLLAAGALAVPAMAADYADLDALDRQVAAFVQAETGQAGAIGRVDRRLRLAPCGRQIAFSWYGRSSDSVLVQCTAPGGWRLFVPVARQAPQAPGASAYADRMITRGDAVTIIVRGEHYRLTDRGTALSAGAAGDWIEVRPTRKDSKPLQARVVSPGVVDIQLP